MTAIRETALENTSNNQLGVSVIGLGRLGAPMLACFAAKGHRVIGVDVDENVVHKINEGIAPVFEPHLQELLHANQARIRATRNYSEAIKKSEITFVVVPTPSDEKGGFSLNFVKTAIEQIGDALNEKTAFHLIVLTSTVLPGACKRLVLPFLEQHSGKRCGTHFGFCYSPEFIALGSVIGDLLKPDFVLIGEADRKSGGLLAKFFQTICDNNPPLARMNIESAELTKIAVNSYVTLKISYANMLAEICEHLPGADVDLVTAALGLDSRIGGKYLKGAVRYGGPCFPRDNVAFAYAARQVGVQAVLAEATDTVNKRQTARLRDHVVSLLPKGGTVAILGLSYKPESDVVEESQGLHLASALIAEGIPVISYDPVAMENARKILGPKAVFASSMEECIRRATVIVLTTPWKEFKEINPDYLVARNGRKVLIDCWRILNPKLYEGLAQYVALGKSAPNSRRSNAA